MSPKSAKAKGRKFQQYVRDVFLKFAPSLEPDDVRSTSMGASGEDILFSPAARRIYPFSVECKNVEKLSIWKAIEQSRENANDHTPLVVFSKNREETFAAIPFKTLMEILEENRRLKNEIQNNNSSDPAGS